MQPTGFASLCSACQRLMPTLGGLEGQSMNQICLVSYSEMFRLRESLLNYVQIAQEVAGKFGVVLTDYAFHTEENLVLHRRFT